jgi:AraC-like DNA-binding protein
VPSSPRASLEQGAGASAIQISAIQASASCAKDRVVWRYGQPQLTLKAGDFVLLPSTPGFTISGFEPVTPQVVDPHVAALTKGEVRHGTKGLRPSVRLLGGYFVFDGEDSGLLVSLLPRQVHVRGVDRLSTLVRLLTDEAAERRSGRELVLSRLVEVLLIESLRLTQTPDAPAGLLRGLGDMRLAGAIRKMHSDPARPWTVAQLAKESALSRSVFFERFTNNVGVPPKEYLVGWRMALAKDLLRREEIGIAEVAERVGYGSASTFSTAFSRYVGQPPGRYSRNTLTPAK